ncbi:putative ribosome biogenesis protein Nop53/GLTSCR2 [Helianthus annuus]|nr:putative ribosome biogenesis protein Nop53/GLTSCR2 [Helianthus annuus]
MGKSRKGKKAWRSNISTQDIEDFYDKSTKDALSGGSLTQLPSDSLFFLDKSRDLSVKRKIDKSRDKILRVDSILQKNSFVKPVPSSNTKKCSRNYKEKDLKTTEATSFKKKDASTVLLDIWNDQGLSFTYFLYTNILLLLKEFKFNSFLLLFMNVSGDHAVKKRKVKFYIYVS